MKQRAITYLGDQNRRAYSPPGTGGVAAHQQKAAKPPLKAQTGWSVLNDHPVRTLLTFDGAATAPVPGGEYACAFEIAGGHRPPLQWYSRQGKNVDSIM